MMKCTICDKPIGSTNKMIREHFVRVHPGITASIEGEIAVKRRAINELIERSSLGTPEAKAIRRRTPPEVRDEILRRLADP